MKKLLLGATFIVLVLGIAFFISPHKVVHAGPGWCDVLANPSSPNGSQSANCAAGQIQNALFGLNNTNSDTLKASFEAYMNTKWTTGYGFQQVGVAYIANGLGGLAGGQWVTRLSNPAVTLNEQSYTDPQCFNTAYDPAINQVVRYSDCTVGVPALVFRHNGAIVYVIKMDCGNPLGNLPGPPPYNPNSPPSGVVTLSCNADGTGTAVGNFSDPNGPTNGYVVVGGFGSSINGSPHAWNIPVANTRGNWVATLYVLDVGGVGYKPVSAAAHGQCNRTPIGVIDVASCTSLAGWAFDPDNSNVSTVMYYNVFDANGTFIETRGGGAAVTNVNRPDVNLAYGITGVHGFNISPLVNLARDFGGWRPITVDVYAGDVNTGIPQLLGRRVINPCPSVSCTSNTFTGTLGVGRTQTFGVTLTASNVNSPAVAFRDPAGNVPTAADKLAVTVRDPGGGVVALKNAGTGLPDNNADIPYSYAGTSITSSQMQFTVSKAGTYTMAMSYPYVVPSPGCNATAQAGYQPYFSVLGGDVEAGPGYGASCTDGGVIAGITGYNRNDGSATQYYGAGSQLAALALGNVTSFASSLNPDASSSGVGLPGGLTVANSAPAGTKYGGGIGLGNTWCTQDYAGTAAASSLTIDKTGTLIGPLNLIDVYSLAVSAGTGNHIFKYVGKSVNVFASQPIPIGTNLTIIIQNGNATVGNALATQIKYAGYNALKDIPQFQLLVSGGNMLIDRSVTELHGVYVAQPNAAGGGGGTLYTCSVAGIPVVGGSPLTDFATCNNPLAFVGAVSAAKIVLGRTSGNLTPNPPATATPAETFEFTPELWLSGWSQSLPAAGSGPVQSITSLPPIL